MKRDFQIADRLIDYCKACYLSKTKKAIRVNRAEVKWAFLDILKEFSEKEIMAVIDYYFASSESYVLTDLLNNFFEYSDGLEVSAMAEEQRRKVREETRERVEKWQQSRLS